MTPPKPLTASDLNKKFQDSKSQLSDHLAEARTNQNLFIGNHFHKRGSKFTRSMEQVTDNADVKIRVTKNHVNTICKHIINSIVSQAPTGAILPKNPTEIQDQKSAEIHAAVLEDYKYRNKLDQKIDSWAQSYVVSGEVVLEIFWDDNAGKKIGENQVTDPVTGEVTGTNSIFEGDVVINEIFSWDLRQDPGAKHMNDAKWLGYEQMVDPDVIYGLCGDTEEIRKICKSDQDETFKVFESGSATYTDAGNKILLRKIYFRPCSDYPKGHFAFFTKDKLLLEGDLPCDQFGNVFFPILYLGFDRVPTSCRSVSIIKQIRPDQMEVNRCASAIALTQMTVGFDKMVVPAGGTVEAGATVAGVRTLKVPGGKQSADYIQGRSGEQFLNTMTAAISEMYQKTGVPEQFDEKTQDTDILATLYKNQRQKMRFSLYGKRFGDFITEVIDLILKLKKTYLRDEVYIRAVGKAEFINIAEYRNADDIGFQIKIEPRSDDLETQYGKHIAITNTMQYLGSNLDKNTIGMLLKQMPFNNSEEIYSEYTQDYETARNILLALDRGEYPPIVTSGTPDYYYKQLEHRTLKPDFRFLMPLIQQNYQNQIAEYQNLYNQNLQQVQAAEQGFIPSDGPTIPIEGMYEIVQGSNGQAKQQRVQVPQAAINWVIEKLKAQGNAFGEIANLPLGQQTQMAGQYQGMSPNEPQQMPVPQY